MKNETNVSQEVITPGFEVVRNEENGYYYFRCNDVNGKIVLWSKDFQTQSIASSKMEHALRLARHNKNYIRKKEDENHTFILVGGNKQEIAKGASFKHEKDIQRTIAYVQQVANSAQALATSTPPAETDSVRHTAAPLVEPSPAPPSKAGAVPEKSKASSAKKESGQTAMQSRYAFKIDLYPREEEDTVWGRIEYLLTEESTTFQGLNMEAMAAFMKKHLPTPPQKEPEKTKPRQERASLVMLSNPNGAIIPAQNTGQGQLYFSLRNLEKGLNPNDRVHAKVTVRSLENAAIVTNQDSRLSVLNEKEALLSLPGRHFTNGVYRIQIAGTVNPTAGMSRIIEANCLFQIY